MQSDMDEGGYVYGVATPGAVAPMAGLDVLRAVVEGRLPQAPISRTLGG